MKPFLSCGVAFVATIAAGSAFAADLRLALRKLVLVGSWLTLIGCSHSAFSADLAVSTKAPPVLAPAPSASWAGLYVGLNGGGGLIRANISDEDCAAFCNSSHVGTGFGEIGGQMGYNWQFGSAVLGVEGDLNWSSFNEPFALCVDCVLGIRGTFKVDALASVRARAGFVVDRLFLYVTAGPAFGHVNAQGSLVHPRNPGGLPISDTVLDDSWHAGIAAGAGAALKMNQDWTLFGEFLYIDLVQKDPTWLVFAPERLGLGASVELARIGLNYQLWR